MDTVVNQQLPLSVVNEGLDCILTHFEIPRWPRRISTKLTEGKQVLVYNKEEAYARFKQVNFLDCRINAYPAYTEYEGINRQPPNFIFVDIDRTLKHKGLLTWQYRKRSKALEKSYQVGIQLY